MGRPFRAEVLLLCALAVCADELPFTHFTPDSGPVRLPSASVQKVFQDHLGFIWMGFFSSGLGRYDGHSIDLYTTADGLGDLTIREIVEDQSGRLWIGSETGLFVSTAPIDSGRRVRFTSRVGNVTLSSLRMVRQRIVRAADGGVIAGVIGGVIHYRFDGGGTLRERRLAIPGYPAAPITNVLPRRDGSVWVTLSDGRFGRWPKGSDRFELLPPLGFDASRVSTTFESARGELWAGTTNGELWFLHRDARMFFLADKTQSEIVSSITEHPQGTIWTSTLGAGVLRLPVAHPEQARRYRRAEGLLGDSTWTILADHEQNLWIGQNGGLSRLRKDFAAFRWYSGRSHTGERPVLPEIGAFTVLPPRRGSAPGGEYTWVSTGGGVSVIDTSGRSAWIQTANGLRSNSVYNVASDSAGRIWIGTTRGLNAITFDDTPVPGATKRRDIDILGRRATLHDVSAASDVIYMVRELFLGERAVCVAHAAGVRCLFGDTWYPLPFTSYSFSVAVDRNGHLWTASPNAGVFRSVAPVTRAALEAKNVRLEPLRFDRLASARVLHAVGDDMWVGVAGGLAVFATDRVALRHFFGPEELGSAAVAPLTSTPGRIWAAQDRGLVEIDAQARKVIRRIDRRDGLINEEFWNSQSIAAGADGLIYCATAGGLTIFDPAAMRANPIPPPVRIRGLSLQQDRSGSNDVHIDFAALSFANEGRVRYRTRLAGYEEAWSAPSTVTSLRYTNLPAYVFPKRYAFEIQASNNDGVWSTPVRAEIFIRPAWWRTWWAYLAYLMAFILSTRGFNSWRTRRLAEHNRELAELVTVRTAELRAHADELATLERTVEAINRETTLDRVFQSVLAQGMTLFPNAEKGAFIILDREKNECEVAALAGYGPEQLLEISALTAEEAVRRYSERAELVGEQVFLTREHEFEQLAGRDKLPSIPPPKVMLTMQVSLGGRFDAFVVFDNFSDPEAFTGADLRKLRRFRQHVLSAIEKARMLREVEEASRAKSSFLARMSHEIRTPLNAIVGFVQLMMRKSGRTADDRENLTVIMRSSDHLLALINDVLSMAKIEAGQVAIHETAFSLRRLVQSVTSTLATRIAAKQLSLVVDVGSDLPPAVRGDEAKLRQVLLNLLDNAVKFTSHGSVSLRVHWKDGGAAFAVEDTGAGMSEEEVTSLFEPFVQTASGVASQQGTGLGLAICRNFVHLLGGEIRVQSAPGRGSSFTFELPLAVAESVEGAEGGQKRVVAGLAPGQPRYRILLADDTEENCLLLEKLLAPLGFDVRSVSNGLDAVEMHAQWKPDLIWMDVRMPVLDGYSATRRIREAEQAAGGRRTIVIALTASAFDHDRARFEAAGCDDFVAKPFLESTIFEKLATHLGVQWTYEELPAEPAPPAEPPLAPERIARIPIAARELLRDALTRGDVAGASRAVDGVRSADPVLADALQSMIRAYRFDDIQEFLE